ncbi:MAG: DsbE family thiol:disulfide interchange protein [Paracoccus sp. (in: a-proteobacteria)]|uniref:DsbE family thiol:disulfide interchange protein n=1 Tax=Paracoccus sp. TaxID=267 RepID=UPI0039E6E1F3
MARFPALMLLPLTVFAGFAGMAGWALLRDDPGGVPSAIAGHEAPEIGTGTLPGKVPLSDAMLREPGLKLVNFWASWCPPCRAEHPTLMALSRELPVYGIDLKDPPASAARFLDEHGDPFRALAVDPRGRTAIDWGVTAPPETFIIDGAGRILYRHAGPLVGDDYRLRFLPQLEKARAAE